MNIRSFLSAYGRIARFLFCGGTAAVVNLAVLYGLTHYAGVWYLLSAAIAFTVGVITSFILQKLVTFKSYSTTALRTEISLYVTSSLFALAANTLLVYIFAEWFGVWYILSQIFAGVLVAFWNFFVYSRFIFSNPTWSRFIAFFSDRPLLSLSLVYIGTNVLMLTNHSLMWDSWLWVSLAEHGDFADLYRRLSDARLYHVYEIFVLLSKTGDMIFYAKVLAFFSWLISGLAIYATLARHFALPRAHAWMISAIYLLIPTYIIKFETAPIFYSVSNVAFFVGIFALLEGQRVQRFLTASLYECLGLALIAFSFLTNSYLGLFLGFLAILFLWQTRNTGLSVRPTFRWARSHIFLIVFPFAFYILERLIIGSPSGVYEGYNAITILNPRYDLMAVLKMYAEDTWQFVSYGLFWPLMASFSILQRKIFFIVFALISIPLYLFVASIRRHEQTPESTVVRQYALAGFILFAFAISTYVMVGKSSHPFGQGFGMRHAVLLPLPSALLIVAAIYGLLKPRLHTYAFTAVLSLFVTFTLYNYYAADMDWYKQLAIIDSLKETTIPPESLIVFHDALPLYNWQNRAVIDFEYSGYLREAQKGEVPAMNPAHYRELLATSPVDTDKVVGYVIRSDAYIEPRFVNWVKMKASQLRDDDATFHAQLRDLLDIHLEPKLVDHKMPELR